MPLTKDSERPFLVSFNMTIYNPCCFKLFLSQNKYCPIGTRGLSLRSIRFCKERNINVRTLRWISDEYLEEMIRSNIVQVRLNLVEIYMLQICDTKLGLLTYVTFSLDTLKLYKCSVTHTIPMLEQRSLLANLFIYISM